MCSPISLTVGTRMLRDLKSLMEFVENHKLKADLKVFRPTRPIVGGRANPRLWFHYALWAVRLKRTLRGRTSSALVEVASEAKPEDLP